MRRWDGILQTPLKSLNFRKQVPKNLAINLFSFLTTLIIGFWLTPYLLKHLGIVAYGFIPLAMFLSSYVSVILNAINISINRFLLITLQKEQTQDSNEIFNTAFVIILAFIVVQSLIMGVILLDIEKFFQIPPLLVSDTLWLFGLTFVGFSLSLFRSVFGTSLFAYNRLDILRVIDIAQNIVRLGVIIFFFTYETPSLKAIGIANLVASLSAIVPTLYYFRRFTPQLTLNLRFFRQTRVKALSKMSFWILINQVGVLLLGNIDLYLVNRFLSPQVTGEYAIILQVMTIFRTMGGLLGGVLTPVIMIYYANGHYDKLQQMTLLFAKLMAIVMVIPLALVVYFSEILLSVWLGESFGYLYEIVSFSLIFLLFTLPMIPFYSINVAYDKVKIPAIATLVLGLLNLIYLFCLIYYNILGLWSVILGKFIYEFLYNAIFMPWYVRKIMKSDKISFFIIPIISMLSFVFVYGVIWLCERGVHIETFGEIVLFGIALFVVLLGFLFYLFLSQEERKLLVKMYIIKK